MAGIRHAVLAPWLIALAALASLTLAAAWSLRQASASPSADFIQFNAKRLDAVAGRGADRAYVVVLLGDSRLKYATADESSLKARLEAGISAPVTLVRLVNNLAVFADFAPLAERIAALQPDLIVLQQDLLLKDRPWLLSAELLRRELLHRYLPVAAAADTADQPAIQAGLPCWSQATGARAARARRADAAAFEAKHSTVRQAIVFQPGGPSAAAAREFVAAQLRLGTQVAVLEMHSEPRYEAWLAAREPRSRALPAALPAGVERWLAPAQDSDRYCDLAHLSREGSAGFSDWLAGRILQSTALAAHDATRVTELR